MNRGPYKPRKAKPKFVPAPGAKKLVRIDERTQIVVPYEVPDEVARNRFIAKINKAIKPVYQPAEQKKTQEVPIGSIEDLTAVVDEVRASEIE